MSINAASFGDGVPPPAGKQAGWLTAFIGKSSSHLASLSPFYRLIVLTLVLLTLSLLPPTSKFAPWFAGICLFLGIIKGV